MNYPDKEFLIFTLIFFAVMIIIVVWLWIQEVLWNRARKKWRDDNPEIVREMEIRSKKLRAEQMEIESKQAPPLNLAKLRHGGGFSDWQIHKIDEQIYRPLSKEIGELKGRLEVLEEKEGK